MFELFCIYIPILMNIVKRIPKLISVALELFYLCLAQRYGRIFRHTGTGLLVLVIIPFHVVPGKNSKQSFYI